MKKQSSNIPGDSTSEFSRRKFLKSAAGSGAVFAAAGTLPIEGLAKERKLSSTTKNSLEEILSRCGSEFGDIRDCK